MRIIAVLCFTLLLSFVSCKKPETKQDNTEVKVEMNTYQSIAEARLTSPIVYKKSPKESYVLAQHINKSGKTPMETAGSAGTSSRTHALVIDMTTNELVWEVKVSGQISWENDYQLRIKEIVATAALESNYLYDVRSRKRISLDGARE